MKTRITFIYILSFILLIPLTSCEDNLLEFYPEDKITSANFPQNEGDIKLLLNGVYALLRENSIYNEGLFGFGILDGATPNAFNWGNTPIAKAGNGQLSSSDGDIVTFRWTRCYAIIFRANYLLNALEEVELNEEVKSTYFGRGTFFKGAGLLKTGGKLWRCSHSRISSYH
ncbi:MAG: hypothetical protein WD426_08795 [Anditalea sp.]